jgi:hypothetical protein
MWTAALSQSSPAIVFSLLPADSQINILSANVSVNIVLTQMLRYIYDAVIWNVDQYQEDQDRHSFVT